VRLLRPADGYYAQFVLRIERRIEHVSTGSVLSIDVGIAAYATDSPRQAVANPRFIRLAEARLKRAQRRLSRRSVLHKKGKKPRNNHAARQRARQNQYPKDPAAPAIPSPSPTAHAPFTLSPSASQPTGGRRSSASGGCT
jgi:putative transposase